MSVYQSLSINGLVSVLPLTSFYALKIVVATRPWHTTNLIASTIPIGAAYVTHTAAADADEARSVMSLGADGDMAMLPIWPD